MKMALTNEAVVLKDMIVVAIFAEYFFKIDLKLY